MPAAPALSAGLAVLKLLAAATAPQSAGVIARDLGLPRSTTYRLLGVLADGGFVTHFPEDRAYGLGVATFEVGTAFLRQDRLERLGRPVLARLAASTRSTAHLGILLGREVLYLLKEQPPRAVPLVTEVGVRLPAHLTASGRALLAALPVVEFRAIYPDARPSSPSAPTRVRGRWPTSGDSSTRSARRASASRTVTSPSASPRWRWRHATGPGARSPRSACRCRGTSCSTAGNPSSPRWNARGGR